MYYARNSCKIEMNKNVNELEMNQNVDDRDKSGKIQIKKLLKFCEVFMLGLTILFIIGLFTIPTVFYAIPSEEIEVSVRKALKSH